MNSAERKFFCLALFLFALGGVSRTGIFNEFSPLENVSLPINYEIAVAAESSESLDTLANNEFVSGDFAEDNAADNNSKSKKTKKPKKKAPSFPISINTANKDDLCFIKGVGPSLAQKIIDHREAKGSFRSAKDLEKVSGIGAKKRMAIEEFVKFD